MKLKNLIASFEISHNNLPEKLWPINGVFMHLEFMKNDIGYWAILSMRAGGIEHSRINLGTYKTVNDVEKLIISLEKAC